MDNPSELILVITTVKSHSSAENIADELLKQRIAACIQIEEEVNSTYRWDGQTVTEKECRMTIKSIRAKWPDIKTVVDRLHPYEVPEILKIEVSDCSEKYRQWILSEIKSQS